ncbi:MAG: HAD family phosphatase [Planctomycetota bacterium]|nr:HAD family phosphatase [Planctomycetota bacterium]
MRLALFDLDNTLLDGDSDIEWSELLARHGAMDAARTRAFHVEYHRGTLDIDAFLRFQLEPLAREPMQRLLEWRREFLGHYIRPRISQAARDLVREHESAGHETVMITATNRFIVEPIAEEFGIRHLIATEPEIVGGCFTGRVAGVPCFREGKVTRFDEWLHARGRVFADAREVWFYSDSHNDLPLLSQATHPVCVGPDPKLAAHAVKHGWPILELNGDRALLESG